MEVSPNNMENFDILNPINTNDVPNEKQKNIEEEKKEENKSCFKFPTAYTILIIIELLIFLLTYIIPKGKFDTIEYNSDKNKFMIVHLDDIKEANATKETLEEYHIDIPLDNFIKGYIKKPISIPGTYTPLDEPNNFFSLFEYPMLGMVESADISFFLVILGGILNILVEMKALAAGMAALSRIMKGKEFLLLIFVYLIISIGGTTFGMCEEILAFYPILMPIFLKSGFDGMLSVAPLYMASMVGTMFSTINAFAVVIASYSAGVSFINGIVFRIIGLFIGDILAIIYLFLYYRRIQIDETNSVVYEIKKEIEDKYLKEEKNDKDDAEKNLNQKEEEETLLKKKTDNNEFTCKQKIALLLFVSGFFIMIIGVLFLDWWFSQMASVFFVIAIIEIFFLGKGEQKGIDVFMKGAGDFIGVAIIVGIARGINQTLEKGKISDTILNGLSSIIDGLPKVVFAILMLIIFIFLGIFIQSSSGLAVLSMPVFAPLADKVGCGRNIIVDAYMYGQNFVGLFSPTGLILIVLQLNCIKYNHWLKFIWPFLVILLVFLIILITIESLISV